MSIIERCSYHGWRIPEVNRRVLRIMLETPDMTTWVQARKIVVCRQPLLTLEMALWAIAQHPGDQIPDPFTVYRALKYTVDLEDRGYEWQDNVEDA